MIKPQFLQKAPGQSTKLQVGPPGTRLQHRRASRADIAPPLHLPYALDRRHPPADGKISGLELRRASTSHRRIGRCGHRHHLLQELQHPEPPLPGLRRGIATPAAPKSSGNGERGRRTADLHRDPPQKGNGAAPKLHADRATTFSTPPTENHTTLHYILPRTGVPPPSRRRRGRRREGGPAGRRRRGGLSGGVHKSPPLGTVARGDKVQGSPSLGLIYVRTRLVRTMIV